MALKNLAVFSLVFVYILLTSSFVHGLSVLSPKKLMLIRIRNNEGTWKIQIDNDNTAKVQDLFLDKQFKNWKVTQSFSKDPSGKEPICKFTGLLEQGLKHGSMIYCRVEKRLPLEDDNADSSPETKNARGVARSLPSSSTATSVDMNTKNQEVIELLDSSDEEENIIAVVSKAPPTKRLSSPSAKGSKPNKKMRDAMSAASSTFTASSKAKISSDISRKASSSSKDFRIVSYNIWFGPPDPTVNQLYPKERMKAIADVLRNFNSNSNSPLYFIGFQEVTSSLRQYLQPHLETMGLKLATQPLFSSYGVGLAVSNKLQVLESKFVPYSNTRQGRGILYVRTATHLFVTTHLESFTGKDTDGSTERQVQIIQATQFCQDQMRNHPGLQTAIVAGDFNWDDERVRGKGPNDELLTLLDGGWRDAGKRLDHTYDAKENCMLGGNLRRRFDRCIYIRRSCSNEPRVTLEKLGKDPIPGLSWNKRNPYNGTVRKVQVAPSDHFAIGVCFQQP